MDPEILDFQRHKKKEHPEGCSEVSGRRGKKWTGDAYNARPISWFREKMKNFMAKLVPHSGHVLPF
jgi:hypothetical protein